jgi:hypothetical protein
VKKEEKKQLEGEKRNKATRQSEERRRKGEARKNEEKKRRGGEMRSKGEVPQLERNLTFFINRQQQARWGDTAPIRPLSFYSGGVCR